MPSDRTQFLYAAITDTQGTIRQLDTKTNYMMVILLIPLLKLGQIYTKCSDLSSLLHAWAPWLFTPLIVLFAITWAAALHAVFKTLVATDDPGAHISGDRPRGSFFASQLFRTHFIDAFVTRPIMSQQQHHQHLADAPATDDAISRELAYEHMKLSYIKSMKMIRSRTAFALTRCWLTTGALLWLSWLALK